MTVTGHSRDTPGQTPNATNTAASLHHILHQGIMDVCQSTCQRRRTRREGEVVIQRYSAVGVLIVALSVVSFGCAGRPVQLRMEPTSSCPTNGAQSAPPPPTSSAPSKPTSPSANGPPTPTGTTVGPYDADPAQRAGALAYWTPERLAAAMASGDRQALLLCIPPSVANPPAGSPSVIITVVGVPSSITTPRVESPSAPITATAQT
jgi:hypothetical protein